MSGKDKSGDGLTYRESGVDIDAQDLALARIRAHLASTKTDGVLSDLGSFGGLFRVPVGLDDPVLVASADGVGTKLMIAWKTGRHDTVGEDLVNHCVNDILVMGARPLFFLDYLAVGKLEPQVAEQLVAGVARGCRANGCALLGGETAEMPEMYRPGEYDLAGTIVGIAPRQSLLDGSRVREGDLLLGLASTGLHTNGFTLARRVVFDRMGLGPEDEFPGTGQIVADALMAVHRSYLDGLGPILDEGLAHALSHITGGGLRDNLPRVIPPGLSAEIELGSWPIPEVFRVLRREGKVPAEDMLRTFNLGVGMVVVVAQENAERAGELLRKASIDHWTIGRISSGEKDVRFVGELP